MVTGMGSDKKRAAIILGVFAIALTFRPVLVVFHNVFLHNTSQVRHSPTTEKGSVHLSAKYHPLKKVAKQSPRPKNCLTPVAQIAFVPLPATLRTLDRPFPSLDRTPPLTLRI
jgi:hypothetical protein